MKTKITKILLLTLVVILALAVFASCNKTDDSLKLIVKDGDKVLTEVTLSSDLDVEALKKDLKVQKDGFEVVGFYTDADLTTAYVAGSDVTSDVTVYVKYAAKSLTISVNSDGGSKVDKISVKTGEAYTVPVPTKEGYDFDGYTYLDDDAVAQPFATSGTYNFNYNTVLTAHWKVKEFYVNFFKADGDTTPVASEKVEYGKKVTAVATTSKAGYDFTGWFEKNATAAFDPSVAITRNVDLYAGFAPHLYTITVEGWHDASVQVRYGETYALVDPESEDEDVIALIAEKVGNGEDQEWATFTGYTYENEEFAVSGTYTYTTNITVVPVTTPNANYNKVTVTFWDTKEDVAFGEAKVLPGNTVAFPEATVTNKAGYVLNGWYVLNGETKTAFTASTVVNANVKVYAEYSNATYTITVKDTDADGDVMEEVDAVYTEAYALDNAPEKFGYTFAGYVYNDAAFAATGNYGYTSDIVVFATWTEVVEAGNFVKVDGENYFKERESASDPYTYVFLTGATYNFNGYELKYEAADSVISINPQRNAFTATKPGDFTLIATKTENNTESRINAKVVYDINTFSVIGDYNGMLANASSNASFQNTVASKDYALTIGWNDFRPELSVTNDSDAKITLEDANVTVSMVKKSDGSAMVADYTIDGNSITFNKDAYTDSGEIVLTFAPKYAITNKTASLTVVMNNGVNAYDNAGFKAAYADLSVQSINVLRNIVAAFDEADYVSGYGNVGDLTLTLEDRTSTTTLHNIDNGTPRNWYGGGVYKRTVKNSDNSPKLDDNLVINGNFFKIDGTKLPYINTILDRTEGVGYDLGNVQIGIFLYRNCTTDNDDYDDVVTKYSNGNLTVNNLIIEGNNIPQYAGATVAGAELPLVKMSTSINGIVVRGGTVNLDNVSIVRTNIAMFMDGGVSGYYNPGIDSGVIGQAQENETQAVKVNVNNAIIAESWCDSFYSFNLVALRIRNTKIGSSSGAAIHFDDRPYGGNADGSCGFSNLNSSLSMDMYTAEHLNNLVAGTEPWFVAYGQTENAALIKHGMETQANGSGLSIITKKEFSDTEFMNFGIVVNQCNADKPAAWAADNHGGIFLETQAVLNYAPLAIFYDETDADENGYPDEVELIGYKASQGDVAGTFPFIYYNTGAIAVYIPAHEAPPAA